MRRIRGKKHKMGTYEINKISLSVLVIKDLFWMTEFMRLLISVKINKIDSNR